MVRPQKPKRGASHVLLEDIADTLFRGPAKTGHGIDLLVRDAQAECLPQVKALERIPEIAVPHMLERTDGAAGLIVFDGALVDALIEQQTLGRISAAPRVARPVTSIDAALSSGFATSVVGKLAALCVERRDASALSGFEYGKPQTDRAALSLAMAEKAYDVLRLTLDLGLGLKSGQALLMFPAIATAEQQTPRKINPAMVALLQDAPLRLDAVLPSVRLPVKTLLGLAPDSVITLPDDILGRAQLRVGRQPVLLKGRVGQLNGRRAIRLDAAPGDQPTPAVEHSKPPQIVAGTDENGDAAAPAGGTDLATVGSEPATPAAPELAST